MWCDNAPHAIAPHLFKFRCLGFVSSLRRVCSLNAPCMHVYMYTYDQDQHNCRPGSKRSRSHMLNISCYYILRSLKYML